MGKLLYIDSVINVHIGMKESIMLHRITNAWYKSVRLISILIFVAKRGSTRVIEQTWWNSLIAPMKRILLVVTTKQTTLQPIPIRSKRKSFAVVMKKTLLITMKRTKNFPTLVNSTQTKWKKWIRQIINTLDLSVWVPPMIEMF